MKVGIRENAWCVLSKKNTILTNINNLLNFIKLVDSIFRIGENNTPNML